MEADLWTDATAGLEDEKKPWAGECRWILEIRKNKETDSPLVLQKGIELYWHLYFSPVRHSLDLWLPELQNNKFVLC